MMSWEPDHGLLRADRGVWCSIILWCTCVSVSVPTTDQHRDTGSHVHVQGCSEWVAGRDSTQAAHQQEPHRRGPSSLHLQRTPLRTDTPQPQCVCARVCVCVPKDVHTDIITTYSSSHTDKQPHSETNSFLFHRAVEKREETWKSETHTERTVSIMRILFLEKKNKEEKWMESCCSRVQIH